MDDLTAIPIAQAALLGTLHALIPCAHSWPILVPFAGPGGRPLRAALLFGGGKVACSTTLGALASAAVAAIPEEIEHRAEELTGLLLLGLAAFLWFRPKAGHLGHLHGECDRVRGPGCGHTEHQPGRFRRYGPALGLFLLGAVNMTIPCWTNAAALTLATSARGGAAGAVVFGAYGLSAALATLAILYLVHRGFHVLDRLASGRVETALLRISALLLVGFALTMLFHWHEH